MNAAQTTHTFPQGTAEVKVTTKYVRIWIDESLAKHLEHPFADPTNDRVEVFNLDGKRYTKFEDFLTDYELSSPSESTEELPLMEEVAFDISQIFVFKSIEDLRHTLKTAERMTQQSLTIRLTGTITLGKQRVEKTKTWIDGPTVITDVEVERVATKWIFLRTTEPQLFVKSLENATFTLTPQ